MITIKLGGMVQPSPKDGEAVISAQYDPLTQTFHLCGRTLVQAAPKRDLERFVAQVDGIAADQAKFLLRAIERLPDDAEGGGFEL